MKSLIRPAGWSVVLAASVWAGFGRAGEGPKPPPPKQPTVMQRKLAHAQRILEALAVNDFEKMRTQAGELQQCAREASWRVVQSQKYEMYSNDFVRHLDDLQKAAKAKNTDAAALAYLGMTMTCVKCHQYVREEKVGAAPGLRRPRADAVATK